MRSSGHRESSSADRLAHVVAALTCGISRQDAVTGGHASPQAQRLNFAAEGDADPPSDDTAFAELYEAHKDSVLVIACADGPPGGAVATSTDIDTAACSSDVESVESDGNASGAADNDLCLDLEFAEEDVPDQKKRLCFHCRS